MLKQGGDEKVEIYYERTLKLTICFQHQINNSLLTIFFQTCLQPYLRIAIAGMKKVTLFEHKEGCSHL
jgi:hypothetical protein